MALRIRLTRGGAKKRPFYHIVVADARSPRDGRFIEKLGFYNPMVPRDHADRIRLNGERAKYWLEHGAQPSDRVAKFLAEAEITAPRPRTEQTKKPLPKAKAQERAKEREEKLKAAQEAQEAEAAEATAAPAAEAGAEAAGEAQSQA